MSPWKAYIFFFQKHNPCIVSLEPPVQKYSGFILHVVTELCKFNSNIARCWCIFDSRISCNDWCSYLLQLSASSCFPRLLKLWKLGESYPYRFFWDKEILSSHDLWCSPEKTLGQRLWMWQSFTNNTSHFSFTIAAGTLFLIWHLPAKIYSESRN